MKVSGVCLSDNFFEKMDGKYFSLEIPAIMGVINMTPDSFFSFSRARDFVEGLKRAEKMIEDGAQIIDIGGESTRPGALPVDDEEEKRRVIPLIRELRKIWNGVISIDTYKANVAREAVDEGADMVNDISGLRFDKSMVDVVCSTKVPVVIMHTSGKPQEMQKKTNYENLLQDIMDYIKEGIGMLEEKGYPLERIIVDPGIGFGKTPEQNLKIIAHLDFFKMLNRPILIGASRKSFIGALCNGIPPEERLPGSLSAAVIAVLNGAKIIRTHDVKETVQAVKIAVEIMKMKKE